MNLLIRFFLVLMPVSSFAQSSYSNFYQVDERAKYLAFTSPDSLARQLTFTYTKDIDKVRAIFRWITENISYNIKPGRRNFNDASKSYLLDDPTDTGALKPLNERVAIDVLTRRLAFCDGYARLFSTLCTYAGIQSEVITGYANGGISRRKGRFNSNHRWNAVRIDSSWYLLDATWASGYVTFSSDEFIKHYNDYYFLTSPKSFVRDHYPDDPRWTLLTDVPEITEFEYSPFKTHAFKTSNVIDYSPKPGIIEASVGDTVQIELETKSLVNPVFIVDSPYIDSAIIADARVNEKGKQWTKQTGNKTRVFYVVNSPDVRWLNVIFDDQPAMRYRLNIRKTDTAVNN
jgi:transglutaminase/protease-like cytokinesis protein 3